MTKIRIWADGLREQFVNTVEFHSQTNRTDDLSPSNWITTFGPQAPTKPVSHKAKTRGREKTDTENHDLKQRRRQIFQEYDTEYITTQDILRREMLYVQVLVKGILTSSAGEQPERMTAPTLNSKTFSLYPSGCFSSLAWVLGQDRSQLQERSE